MTIELPSCFFGDLIYHDGMKKNDLLSLQIKSGGGRPPAPVFLMKYDSVPMQILETGEGFIKAIITFAVPGVLPYNYDDGTVFEAKLPEDVLSPETIQSANGAPVTDGHPVDSFGNRLAVTPENYQQLSKGAVSNAHMGDGQGKALITIYDQDLINAILNGKNGISMGFMYDYDLTPGIFNGVRYDKSQTNIRVNHIAVVDVPRAGIENTKINLYGDSAMMPDRLIKDGKSFVYKTLDGSKQFSVDSEDIAQELLALNKKIKADSDALEAAHAKLQATKPSIPDPDGQKEKEDLVAQVEQHKANEEALMEQLKAFMEKFDDNVDQAVGDKMDATENVKAIDCNAKTDGMSTLELRKIFIEKASGGRIKTDGMDKVKINAHYQAAKNFAILESQKYKSSGNMTQVDSSDMAALEKETLEKLNSFQNAYSKNNK